MFILTNKRIELKLDLDFEKYTKKHSGGCLLYCLAALYGVEVEHFETILKVDKTYWFSERDLERLKDRDNSLEILSLSNFSYHDLEEAILGSLIEKHPIILLSLDRERGHAYLIYGCSISSNREKITKVYLFDPNGKFFKKKVEKIFENSLYLIRRRK